MTDYKSVFQLAQDKGCNTSLYKQMEKSEMVDLFLLTVVQKWLRDEHRIVVVVFPYDAEDFVQAVYGVNVINIEWGTYKECHIEKMLRNYPPSYEEALLKGTFEALKLIP